MPNIEILPPRGDPWAAFPDATPPQPASPDSQSQQLRQQASQPQGGDDPWASFPDATSASRSGSPQQLGWSDYASDAGKSAGIGLAKGVTGLVGIPGDASNLMDKVAGAGADAAFSYLAEKAGMNPEEISRVRDEFHASRRSAAPTSSEVRSAIEDNVTGPWYEPKTQAGNYAERAAEFVPAALLGATSLPAAAANAVRYGVLPGAASEFGGQLTKGTAAETPARLAAGLIAGVGVGALTRPATATRALASKMPDFVRPQDIDAAESLIKDAAARGVALTWPEALSQVTGRPVLSDMMRFVESAPQSRQAMQDFHAGRPQEIETTAQRELSKISPPNMQPSTVGPAAGGVAESAINDVRGQINAVADPFYRSAEGVLLAPPEMARATAIPGVPEAIKAVRSDPQLNRYVSHLPDDSVGFLNEIKKYLDTAAKNAAGPLTQNPNMQRAAGYGQDARAVSGLAQSHSVDYATALGLESFGREKYLKPLLDGPLGKIAQKDVTTRAAIDALFPKNPLPNSEQEIKIAVGKLASRSPRIASDLVRAHLEMKLDEAFNAAGRGQEAAQFAGAGFANRVAGSPVITGQKVENLRAAVEALPGGKQTWQGFKKFLEVAQATGTRQPIGSKTAFNEQDFRLMQSGSVAGNIGKNVARPVRWLGIVGDLWGQWQLGSNLDRLAVILTDPRSAAALKRLANVPTGAREAKMLVARSVAVTTAGQDRTKAPPSN